MHDGLAQVLRAGLAALVERDDALRRAVVVDDDGVVDRDVGGAQLEVDNRVAALGEQFAHQAVGLDQHALGIVDERGLQALPGLREARHLGRSERHDLEVLHALLAPPEFRLGLGLAAEPGRDGVVLRPEALPEPLRLIGAIGEPGDGADQDHHDGDDEDQGGCAERVHGDLRIGSMFSRSRQMVFRRLGRRGVVVDPVMDIGSLTCKVDC